ncbi:MAG TPA: DUF2267 domain-containing protein [Stenomitos sp.]
MNKGEFIHRVQALTGIQERDRAEKVTGTVLGTLCGRITNDEAKDLESQLPTGIDSMCRGNILQELVSKVSGPNRLDRDAFVERVKDRGSLKDAAEAENVTIAVFRTLKEQITEGEAGDVAAQLPSKLKIMWLES